MCLLEKHAREIMPKVAWKGAKLEINPKDVLTIDLFSEKTAYVLVDLYQDAVFAVHNKKCHLVVVMEIFEVEYEFTRQEGSDKLIDRLQKAGYYPQGGLDRKPVI